MEDRIRVIRILEYEGPRHWVEDTLQRRAVKGEHVSGGANQLIIREAILGETPTVLMRDEEEPT